MGRGLLKFTAGLGEGYMGAEREDKLDKERAEDRAIRLSDAQWTKEQRDRQRQLEANLGAAARPVTVSDGAVVNGISTQPTTYDDADLAASDVRQARNAGGLASGQVQLSQARTVGGKAFPDESAAQAAAAAANTPEAVTARQAAVMRTAGKPGEALTLENAQAVQKREAFRFTAEQEKRARELKDEGYLDAGRAMRAGNAQGVFEAFNRTGTMKLQAPPTLTPIEVDVPGMGKVKAFEASGFIVGPDGTPQDFKVNSHDFSMYTMPYEKILETQRKGTDTDNRHAARMEALDLKGRQVELQGLIAEAKAAKASGGGNLGREERLRFTSLFQDAGRRLGETQKSLNTLMKDPLYASAKPGTERYAELEGLRETAKQYESERSTFQSLLAGGEGGKAAKSPSLADAKPAATAVPQKVNDKATYDKLPKGARYIAPDGSTRVKG